MARVFTFTKSYTTKPTSFANDLYLVDEKGKLAGIARNFDSSSGGSFWFVGDKVKIEGDCYGYICPGITKPGIGVIVEIREDDNDHWFHVQMIDSAEHGFCKVSRFAAKL